MTGSARLFTISLGVLAAFVTGFFCGRYRTIFDAERFLYGALPDVAELDDKYLRLDASEAGAFYTAIHMMLTDYRNRPTIEQERKLLLLRLLRNEEHFKELPLSLALGSIVDESAEVREACVAVLWEWQDTLSRARYAVERNVHRESNDAVRQKKEAFLRSGQVRLDSKEVPARVEELAPTQGGHAN